MGDTAARGVAFLDTNVLHFMSLYLGRAKTRRLYPLEGDIAAANVYLDTVTDKKLRESLTKGLDAVVYLSNGDFRVEYQLLSEFELMGGRARGRAIEKAAKEGIPDRMWGQFGDAEIGARLIPVDLADIRAEVDELVPALNHAGVDAAISDRRRTREVLDIARHVAGLVYMSVMDSIIYASALVAEADHLISYDTYLSATANRIKTGQPPFPEIRRQLQARIETTLLKQPGSFTFPEARKAPARSR